MRGTVQVGPDRVKPKVSRRSARPASGSACALPAVRAGARSRSTLTRRGKDGADRSGRRRLAAGSRQLSLGPAAGRLPRAGHGHRPRGQPVAAPCGVVDRRLDLVQVARRWPRRRPRRWARPRTTPPGSPPAAPGWWCAATAPARSRRSTSGRRPAVSASAHSAARTPPTLFAAIDAPVPVQQHTMPWSARPSATSRAAASLAQAQSSRSPSASAPCSSGSWPSARRRSTTASATPVRSSDDTLTFIAAEGSLGSPCRSCPRSRSPPAASAPRWPARAWSRRWRRAW